MRVTRKAGKVEALRQAVAGLDGAQARVGWFESAKYEKGQPVAGIAAVQEFGSPSRGIPPRPFFRTTATERADDWRRTAEQVSRAAARGEIDPDKVMEAVALAAGGHVRATLTKITDPPLKDATIDARRRRLADKGASLTGAKGAAGVAGIAKPLVDSGILLNSLAYEANGVEHLVKETGQ
jgi:hypothetical protein